MTLSQPFRPASLPLFVLLAFAAAPLAAQPLALGSEIRANAGTSGDQWAHALGANRFGDFSAAWLSGSSPDVVARAFDASGSPGSDLAIAPLGTSQPKLGVADSGMTVVVWSEPASSNSHIRFRRCQPPPSTTCASAATANSTNGDNGDPVVAVRSDGNFLVVWVDPSGYISSRLFDATGSAVTSEQGVGVGGNPSVAWDPTTGDFGVAWEFVDDFGDLNVAWREVDSGGSPVGSAQIVHTATGHHFNADIAYNPIGDAAIVWQALDESGWGIWARVYDAANDPYFDNEDQVNVTTAGNQELPAIAPCSSDDFVTVWQSAGEEERGSPIYTVGRARPRGNGGMVQRQLRAYDDEFVVAQNTPAGFGPDIAPRAPGRAGKLVVSYEDDNRTFADSDYAVYLQHYACYGEKEEEDK